MNDTSIGLRHLKLNVIGVMLVGTLTAMIVLSSLIAWRLYTVLPKELALKQATEAQTLSNRISYALSLGIPLADLRGIDTAFDTARDVSDEIDYLILEDTQGHILAKSGTRLPVLSDLATVPITSLSDDHPKIVRLGPAFDMAWPVSNADQPIATLHVGVAVDYVRGLIFDRLIDVLTVMVVIAIICSEFMQLLIDHWIVAPLLALRQWQQALAEKKPIALWGARGRMAISRLVASVARLHPESIGDPAKAMAPWPMLLRYIRVSVFVFVLGDSLPLSFLPMFGNDVLKPFLGLSPQFLLSLPVAAFWFVSAIAQMPAAWLLDRYQHRTVFLLGAILEGLGYLFAALCSNMVELVAARAITGIGFGLMFTSAQAAILVHVPVAHRTMGVATFTGVFFLATFAGTALGGVAAQQFGYRTTFILSLVVVLAAGALAAVVMGRSREPKREKGTKAGLREYGQLLGGNVRFVSLLLLCAVPNRTFNAALLSYLAPMYLASLQYSKSEIGRVVALYGIIMALCGPLLARWVDRKGMHVQSVVGGTLLTASGAAGVFFLHNIWGMLLSVLMMGLGQALSIPAQVTLVPKVGEQNVAALGLPRMFSVFRVGERVPSFAGLMLAAALSSVFGYDGAVCMYGAWLAISGIILGLVFSDSIGTPTLLTTKES